MSQRPLRRLRPAALKRQQQFRRRLLLEGLEERVVLAGVPAFVLPGNLTIPSVPEDSSITFLAGVPDREISITDSDAGTNPLELSLSVDIGSLTLGGTAGLTLIDGDGSDGTLKVKGTLADLNAALDGLTYAPPPNDDSTAILSLKVNDLSTPPNIVSATQQINIGSVNDPPTNVVPGPLSTTKNTPLMLNGISFSDFEPHPAEHFFVVNLVSTGGKLTVTAPLGVVQSADDFGLPIPTTNTTFIQLQGPRANLITVLNSVRFDPDSAFEGYATVTLTTNDLGNGGKSGATDTDDILITVGNPPPPPPPPPVADPVLATGPSSDQIRVRRVGDNVVVTSGAATLLDQLASTLTSLTILGQDGNDTLTIDYSGGALPAVQFDGGAQAGAPGDSLVILGAGLGVTSRPNDSRATGAVNFGAVEVGGSGLVTYQNIEPLDIDGMGGPVSIALAGGSDVLHVADGFDFATGLVPAIRVSGTSGGFGIETHAIYNASLLSIDTTAVDGSDTIALGNVSGSGMGGASVQSLSVDTGSLGDVVDVSGAVTFALGSVSLVSDQIDFNVGGQVSAMLVVLIAATGSITDGDAGLDVSATTLSATAATGISLDTAVDSIVSAVSAAGAVQIDEVDAVSVGGVLAATGSVFFSAGGTVTVESISAPLGTASVAATGGSIVSAASDPGVADIVASTATLSVTGAGNDIGISAASPLEIEAAVLNASTSGAAGNDIFIRDLTGDLALGLVTAGAGNVNLRVAQGNLTSAAGDAGIADLVGNEVTLTLDMAGRQLGTSPADRLELNAVQLQVLTNTTAVNNAYILDTAGGLRMQNSTVGGIAGSTFDILVQSGSLTTVNDATRDVGADIIRLEVTGAGSTIGTSSANQLEVNALTSVTALSAGGSIFLDDTSGDLPVAFVDAVGATVDLRSAQGNIISVAGDPGVPDVVGGTINLRLGTGNRRIGLSAADRLEIDGTLLQIFHAGPSNNYFIVDTAGGLATNNSTTGGDPGVNVFDLLVLNGGLTSQSIDGTGDVRADQVIVRVTGLGNSIGTSQAAPLEINANIDVVAATDGGNIFLRDISADFPLGLIDAGTGIVDLHAPVGAIVDANGAATSIVGSAAALRARNGIGSTDPLETAVSSLAASNSLTGNLQLTNSVGGLLTLGSVNGVIGLTNSAPNGQVLVSNASPLTVAATVTAAGLVALTAADSPAAGDDLTFDANVFVQSLNGSVTLSAGDDLSIGPFAVVSAGTTITLNIDNGDADAGVGGNLLIGLDADLDAPGEATFIGANDDDSFTFRPDDDTPISVFGFDPTVPTGDVMNLDLTGLGVPTLLLGPGANNGQYSFGGLAADVTFSSIETVNAGGGAANVVLDMEFEGFQDGAADEIFVRLDPTGTDLLIDVNGASVFTGAVAGIQSLAIVGSDDDELLRIDETAGGLPLFSGQSPAVNNVGVGGGAANAAHLNGSANLLLNTLVGPPGTWDVSDVTFHFDGRGGSNAIDLNLITQHDTAYTSDNLDSGNSGNLGTIGAGGVDLLLSFANLAPLNLTGAGGSLVIDASSTPATSNLTISNDGLAADGWSQVAGNGGFETTRFRGFAQLFVVGGSGSELIEQLGLDSATSLTRVQIQGGNSADLLNLLGGDGAADTIRLYSAPAGVEVVIDGDAGDDLIQLFDSANSVDNILAAVTITGDSGNDTLVVVDSGSAGPDTIVIDETSIDGITGFAGGLDIAYSNIDFLHVTGTQGSDTLDANFNPGSDLDFVTLNGWTGADQLFLRTSDEAVGGPATGIQTINLNGDAPGNPNPADGNDIFGETPLDLTPGAIPVFPLGKEKIRPSVTTTININGGQPTASPNPPVDDQVGDILNLDVTLLNGAMFVATLGANPSLPGIAQSVANPPLVRHAPVTFQQIEDINLCDRGILTDVEMGDLYVRGTDGADNVQFFSTADPNVARTRINSYQNYFTVTRRTVVYALGGNDYIQQGSFNHVAEFYGGDGDDYLQGYNAGDKLVGGAGRDRINAGQGNNVVWGDRDPVEYGLADTEANRQLLASDGFGAAAVYHPQNLPEASFADILSTLTGNDIMYGGPGADSMTLGAGGDYAYGGLGNDTIDGGDGNDRLYGGDGNDRLTGANGNDILSGGEGADWVLGGTGHDVVIGGGGNDTMTGDAGNDVLFDGRTTYGGVSTESRSAGDAEDQALMQLLADWLANSLGAFTNDHDGTDTMRGHAGNDAFSAGSLAEILDFNAIDDTLLP
jgi:hypothetical protein